MHNTRTTAVRTVANGTPATTRPIQTRQAWTKAVGRLVALTTATGRST